VIQPMPTPWYEYWGLDFISENLVPTEIRDQRVMDFTLTPQVIVPTDQLLGRAEELRRNGASPLPGTPAPAGIPISSGPPVMSSPPPIAAPPAVLGGPVPTGADSDGADSDWSGSARRPADDQRARATARRVSAKRATAGSCASAQRVAATAERGPSAADLRPRGSSGPRYTSPSY